MLKQIDLRSSWNPQAIELFFTILLLSSGFCGISYEILYGRILGNIIGDQFIVSASILLTFLLGIGIGTLFAHKLWKYLWIIEGSIGVYGALVALNSNLLDKVLYTQLSFLHASIHGSLIVCIIVLIFPAFLIGTSLPLFAGYLNQINAKSLFSKAYAIYNFGAAITVLLIEYWLIRKFGITHATLCIAYINFMVACCLYIFFSPQCIEVPTENKESLSQYKFSELAALAIFSISSAVFQLLMVKIAEFIYGPFRETFALVLSIVFIGIAIGSWLVKIFKIDFSKLIVLNLISIILIIGGFDYIIETYASLYPKAIDSYFNSALLKLGVLSWIMGVPALTFGATIPALLRSSKSNVAKDSGLLLFISSIANAAGFLIMTIFLHKNFDYGIILLIICGTGALTLLLLPSNFGYNFPIKYPVAIVLILLAISSYNKKWTEDTLYLGYRAFHSTKKLEKKRERFNFPEKYKGYQDVFSIVRSNNRPYFFINGYISIPLDSSAEVMVGAFSSIFAPRTDNALVLGVGSGATLSGAGLLFDKTTGIEINNVILENLYRMKEYNFDVENNPNVTIIHDDAIHFTKVNRDKYSLIINTVTTPLYFSSAKLYTQDFLETVKKRLTPDGVYVTWIDSRVGDKGLDVMVNTLTNSFDYCSIGFIRNSYFLLFCSNEPIKAHHPKIAAKNTELSNYFKKKHDINPEWLVYNLLNTEAKFLIGDKDTLLNTIDYPALEFEMTKLRKRGFKKFKKRLLENMSLNLIEDVIDEKMEFNPTHLLIHAEEMLGKSSSLFKRWKSLVKKKVKNYGPEYAKEKIKYIREYADKKDKADDLHNFGFRLLKDKHYESAILATREALKINPKRNNSYFNIGACYEYLEKYPEAIRNYANEHKVDEDDNAVQYRIGRVLVKSKKYKKGLLVLDKAHKEKKRSGIYYFKGVAYENLNMADKAIKSYKSALRMDKKYSQAKKALKRLQKNK